MESLKVSAKQNYIFLSITLVIAWMVTVNANVPRLSNRTPLRPLSEEMRLYNDSDKVRILTDMNFNNEVLNRNHSILVKFYNIYSSHSRRFASTYKQLAKNLYDWRSVLTIAVIDCAEDDNIAICLEYDAVAFPTLRYFGPAFLPSDENHGKPITSQDINIITNNLVQFLVAENKTSKMSSWPDLQPVKTSLVSKLFEGLDSMKKYVILIYEPDNSTLGVETILHFSKYSHIAVKRICDMKLANKYKIDGSRYKIAIVNRQGAIVPYASLHELAISYKEIIKSFFASLHITEHKPEHTIKPEYVAESTIRPEHNLNITEKPEVLISKSTKGPEKYLNITEKPELHNYESTIGHYININEKPKIHVAESTIGVEHNINITEKPEIHIPESTKGPEHNLDITEKPKIYNSESAKGSEIHNSEFSTDTNTI